MPGLRSCPSPALGLGLKVGSSVWCENRGGKKSSTNFQGGHSGKKKKAKVCWRGAGEGN